MAVFKVADVLDDIQVPPLLRWFPAFLSMRDPF